MLLGRVVGVAAGEGVGVLLGRVVGVAAGEGVGVLLGRVVGVAVGEGAGVLLGRVVGVAVGEGAGVLLGRVVGVAVGEGAGVLLGRVVGVAVGEGVEVLLSSGGSSLHAARDITARAFDSAPNLASRVHIHKPCITRDMRPKLSILFLIQQCQRCICTVYYSGAESGLSFGQFSIG